MKIVPVLLAQLKLRISAYLKNIGYIVFKIKNALVTSVYCVTECTICSAVTDSYFMSLCEPRQGGQ
jgi:hypothetical protein